jgi:hypothetical protein
MSKARDKANSTVSNFASTGIDDNADANAITIDSSENVLVGTTNTDPAFNNVAGTSMAASGQFQVTRNGGIPALINRKSDNGTILDARKDGTTVGSISTSTGVTTDLILDPRSSFGSGISGAGLAILPMDHSQRADNHTDLGEASNRWKNLYLSGNLYLGGTGSANAISDVEEGDWTPTGNGQTLTNNFAKYRKIGSLVAIQAYIVFPTNSDTSGNANIAGLPFAGTQPSNAYGAFTVGYSDKGSSFTILKGNTTTDMDLRLHDGNNVKNADMSGKTLIFAGVYISV